MGFLVHGLVVNFDVCVEWHLLETLAMQMQGSREMGALGMRSGLKSGLMLSSKGYPRQCSLYWELVGTHGCCLMKRWAILNACFSVFPKSCVGMAQRGHRQVPAPWSWTSQMSDLWGNKFLYYDRPAQIFSQQHIGNQEENKDFYRFIFLGAYLPHTCVFRAEICSWFFQRTLPQIGVHRKW